MNELRESTMFKYISSHSIGSAANQGVFLVGTAHRKALVDRIQKLHDSDETRVVWNHENPFN